MIQMEADFTLVPHGGLGNRIYAICSAIAYCSKKGKSLKILWFKDPGLNCSVNELMAIDPRLTNVQMYDGRLSDFILRDNPRRKNFWIPKLFQYFLFDRRIYFNEVYQESLSCRKPFFGGIDHHKHIFMVSYWKFWEEPDMWKSIVIDPQISQKVAEITNSFKEYKRIIGIHIRRTDNMYAIKESPTDLFVEKIQEEIDLYKDNVCFYLASDSLEEKNRLIDKFGDQIITSLKQTSRNNKEGIIDAFVEMNVLSKTDKIYASSCSSFSEIAHLFSNNEFKVLTINKS